MDILNNFRRYIAPEFSVMDTSWISRLVSSAARERARHLEMMACAFVKETKIPVKYCELVEEHQIDKVVYYFRDKRTTK